MVSGDPGRPAATDRGACRILNLVPTLELVTHIAAQPAELFDLSLDVGAHTASMSGSGERIVGGVRTGRMKLGDTVTWSARHFGIPWRMTSRISAYERPVRFVDEQVRGPFRSWHHEHSFTWDPATETTVMRDVISFAAPFGIIGRVVERLVLRGYMERLIASRNKHLSAQFPH